MGSVVRERLVILSRVIGEGLTEKVTFANNLKEMERAWVCRRRAFQTEGTAGARAPGPLPGQLA